MTYRTRYAPSPTGAMHLGHARTALITWARARRAKGQIVMRIEDLDEPRVLEGAEAGLLRDHEWLGLLWDEGPVRQSEHQPRYEAALERLAPHLFPCSCTRKEVRAASAPHEGEGRGGYPGTCRQGPRHPERPHAIRFRMDETRTFNDGWFGTQPAVADDFIVRRSDGLFAYQLAVVVDDGAAKISEVVRGADLLDSTPRQIALYEALGLTPPAWLHLPLVRDEQGTRISKRNGAIAIADYREAGWTAEKLIGMLAASLGHGEGGPLSLDAFTEEFEVDSRDHSHAFDLLPPPI